MRFPSSCRTSLAFALLLASTQTPAATVPPGCVRVSGEEGNGTDVYIGTEADGSAIWCAAGSAAVPGVSSGYGAATPAAGGYGQPPSGAGYGYGSGGGYGGSASPAQGWGGQGSSPSGSTGGYGATAGGGYGGAGYGSSSGGYGGGAAGGSGGFQGGSFGNKGGSVSGGANPYSSGKPFTKRERGWQNAPPAGATGGAGYGAPYPGNADGSGASPGYGSGYGSGPSSSQDPWPSQEPGRETEASTPPASGSYGGPSSSSGYDGGLPLPSEPQGGSGGHANDSATSGTAEVQGQEPAADQGDAARVAVPAQPLKIDPDRLRGTANIPRNRLGNPRVVAPEVAPSPDANAALDASSAATVASPPAGKPKPPRLKKP